MPQTKPRTDTEWDIETDHYRMSITRSSFTGRHEVHKEEHRRACGWTRLHPIHVPDRFSRLSDNRSDLIERGKEMAKVCARLYQQSAQQKAERKADSLDYQRRKQQAKTEYRDWLQTLPLTADAYKEGRNRMKTGYGEEGRESREMSVTEWLAQEAQRRWPEEACNVKAEIKGRYNLPTGVLLA